MGVYGGPDINDTGLVLALDAGNVKSYPGSGTTWTSLISTTKRATLTNGPTYSSANGGYIAFDGVNDYALLSSYSESFTAGFTAEMFVYIVDFNAKALFNYPGFAYLNGFLDASQFRFEYKSAALNNRQLFTTGTRDTSVWYHVAYTLDSSGAKIYLNGQLNVSNAFAPNFTSISSDLYLGSYDTAQYMFNGRIASFKQYNRALTASEVQQNFNATRGRYGI